jgi:hypothetical protein
MATHLGTVHGSDWETSNSSDFEPDALPRSPVTPSYIMEHESVLSDDLKLYDARWVH